MPQRDAAVALGAMHEDLVHGAVGEAAREPTRSASLLLHVAQLVLVGSVVALVLDPAHVAVWLSAFGVAYAGVVAAVLADRRGFHAGDLVFKVVQVVQPASVPPLVELPVAQPAQPSAVQLIAMPIRIDVT